MFSDKSRQNFHHCPMIFMRIPRDFYILECGVKTEQHDQAADDLGEGHASIVFSRDKVFLKLNKFLRSELAYRACIKPSVIAAHLPFRNFPDYEGSQDNADRDKRGFPLFNDPFFY